MAKKSDKKQNRVKAIYKFTGISAQKLRLTADLIKNMEALEALNMLEFVNKKGAKIVTKALNSAYHNAINNNSLDKSRMFVDRVYVDEAPTIKRFRVASRKGYREVLKRSSHLTVELIEK